MLKLLFYGAFLHTIFALQVQHRYGFGTSNFANTTLCRQWSCVNSKLGLPNTLPPKEEFVPIFKSLLPEGTWQEVALKAVDQCYEDRALRYTNTCPGQALLHCTVDSLIQLCPDSNVRKDDACSPLTTIAGFKYMFSQSRYVNLEQNLPKDPRPEWFLKHYFNSKCCELPVMFKPEVLQGCGFDSFMRNIIHMPHFIATSNKAHVKSQNSFAPKTEGEKVKVVNFSENKDASTPKTNEDVKVVNISNEDAIGTVDPLDCCDLSGFIEPSWRSECGFQLSWDKNSRLSVLNNSVQVSTAVAPTTVRPAKMNDVKVVPQSCEKSTCIFRRLNIITENGTLDLDAFSKLLDNVTNDHKSWVKAKARVVTKCLRKPLKEYVYECEINQVLGCTFDILSENCPHAKKHDPCKHSTQTKKDITCQISSSKFRPKFRRQFCGIPSLVNHEVLTQCDVNSLSRMEFVPDPVTSKPTVHWWKTSKYACQSSTDSTKCLLTKMAALNKYGFIDYFKMKDRIRTFTSGDNAWSSLAEVYLNTFTGVPMYGGQCSTPKKLLNVIDAMLMTCPMSKRKHTLQCNRILTDMAITQVNHQISKDKLTEFWRHFHHVYAGPLPAFTIKKNHTGNFFLKLPVIPKQQIHRNPPYDFGLLNSKDAPKIDIIDVKPNTTRKPLVLLPVYMTMNGLGNGGLIAKPNDGIWRSAPSSGPIHPMVPNMPI